MRRAAWPIFLSILFAMLLGGCSSRFYKQVRPGKLSGGIYVHWIAPDEFVFLPNESDRLTFTRANGEVIRPGPMYTDGGSIPRPLWVFRNYSPWGYAPAFIVHDWLFDQHHCDPQSLEGKYSLDDTALIMAEVMKTMMESGGDFEPDPFTLTTMHEAVRSPIAERVWGSGICRSPTTQEVLAAKGEVSQLLSVDDKSAREKRPLVYLVQWPPAKR